MEVGGLKAERRSSLNPAMMVDGPGSRAFGMEIMKQDFSFDHDVVGRLALLSTFSSVSEKFRVVAEERMENCGASNLARVN
jgi:hypothetical protein